MAEPGVLELEEPRQNPVNENANLLIEGEVENSPEEMDVSNDDDVELLEDIHNLKVSDGQNPSDEVSSSKVAESTGEAMMVGHVEAIPSVDSDHEDELLASDVETDVADEPDVQDGDGPPEAAVEPQEDDWEASLPVFQVTPGVPPRREYTNAVFPEFSARVGQGRQQYVAKYRNGRGGGRINLHTRQNRGGGRVQKSTANKRKNPFEKCRVCMRAGVTGDLRHHKNECTVRRLCWDPVLKRPLCYHCRGGHMVKDCLFESHPHLFR